MSPKEKIQVITDFIDKMNDEFTNLSEIFDDLNSDEINDLFESYKNFKSELWFALFKNIG